MRKNGQQKNRRQTSRREFMQDLAIASGVAAMAPSTAVAGATWGTRPGLLFLTARNLEAEAPQMTDRSTAHDLLPVPASVEFHAGRLALDSAFSVAVQAHTDAPLERAVDRMLKRLEARTGLTLSRARNPKPATATLVVRADGPGMKVQGPEEDESYALEITGQQASLHAPTVVGILRGLETFLQLVESNREGFFLPLGCIQDRPRFPWRGLLIDVCRHWQPVEVIKRNLDAMAAVKLNVLHWHLSEDQGFRVESRRYPKLHELGSDGLYYTQQQIREVIAYARDRGIRVVPEFDMPGHSTAWFVGYAKLASAPGPYSIERTFGVKDPTFDPTRKEVFRFIDRFVGEMAKLFPDPYWHIGGDEVTDKQWDANPAIRAFKGRHDLKDNAALQAYFNQQLARILRKHGKHMVGWDEILHPDLSKDVAVQSWRGAQSLGEGAKQGYQGILSAGYYLDAMWPAEQHYRIDPLPADSALDASQAARILGGEVCMWGELVTRENIDSRIWPRTAAIAERLWSPRNVTDVDDMYRRLTVVSVRLEDLGVMHLAGPDMMLRRLVGSAALEPLRALWGIVEPVSLGQRMQTRPATQLTPLTTLGDIAIPDPPGRHEFGKLIDALLNDAPRYEAGRENLAREFLQWHELRNALEAVAERAPLARDAEGVTADLAELGAAGQEALSYLSQGVVASREWTEQKLALLEHAGSPKGLLRIGVLPALRRLIVAAGGAARAPV